MSEHDPVDTLLPLLDGVRGVRAGTSIRPVDAADRTAARSWAARAARVSSERVAMLHQVHGQGVVVAPWEGLPAVVDGDAMVSTEADLALAVRVADCAPVALAHRQVAGVGLVHAGWRGATSGVVPAALAGLGELTGADAGAIHAAVGPTIGVCCYKVGPEVARQFPASVVHRREESVFLDLVGAVAYALEEAGVPAEAIDLSGAFCTACGRGGRTADTFHSHRGSGGAPGRNIAFIVLEGR